MNRELENELRDSLYIHRPLPLHREREFDARFVRCPVEEVRTVGAIPSAEGAAEAGGLLRDEGGAVGMTAPLRCAPWPKDTPGDVGYRNFGVAQLVYRFEPEDWTRFDRLRFEVSPRIEGGRVFHLNVSVASDGRIPVPDRYWREGASVFDLEGESWNDCVWEFGSMPRDAVRELRFYVFCAGHDTAAGETETIFFRNVRLERVKRDPGAAVYPGQEGSIHTLGWENPIPGIRLSSAGYFPAGDKTAVAATDAETFTLTDEKSGICVYEGPVRRVENERGRFAVLDFSAVDRPGLYRLRAGDLVSPPFPIGEEIAREARWKALNFLFCQRCGYPVPGKHGACHLDFLAEHNGETVPFHGGWHDAGDTSQQAAQTAETVETLYRNALLCKDDPLLYGRLMEEAGWGLDFILRTRFGDGFRATSAGSTRWSDNKLGTFDDVACRVFDHSYENYLFAGAEAAAAEALRGFDPGLSVCARRAAEEDFAFAEKTFAERGVEPAHMFEHTYNSGLSQYYAVSVRSACRLFALTGDPKYRETAVRHGSLLMACQETGDLPFAGFFCRDDTKRTPVHFNHQAREHQFPEALVSLCETFPDAPDKPRWEESLRLYGRYLRFLAGACSPWGMIPAGVHRIEESEDRDLFPYLHVTCDYDAEKEHYRAQLKAGRDLGDGYVLRHFPVWFSFRGNSAVLLSMGRAAGVAGRYLGDEDLVRVCREQLYWIWGKNPFGQSLMYGMGRDYSRLYTVHMGETVGAVPVGIETREDGDEPYWPGNNNATYREIWIGAVCRFLEALECV